MLLNANTVICGDRCILVPYCKEHVERYHEWMKSPELLEATASEPLSLEEEYDMQRKWREDEDSTCEWDEREHNSSLTAELTFIILARPTPLPPNADPLLIPAQIAECPMVGDVNLFIPEADEDAEAEIMIAGGYMPALHQLMSEHAYRRKGIAKEALTLFLAYVINTLGVSPRRLIARIGDTNASSIALFGQLGFGKVKDIRAFEQVELRWGWVPATAGDMDVDDWAAKTCIDTPYPPAILASRVGSYTSP